MGGMSESPACQSARAVLGPVLLGRADAQEQEALRRHLEECPACRADYADLVPVVSLLSAVDPDTLSADQLVLSGTSEAGPDFALAAPPHLRASVLDALSRQDELARRRRRRRLAAAPVAAAAAVVALLLVLGLPGSGVEVTRRQLSAVGGASVSGSVELVDRDQETLITVEARGMVVNQQYGFWLERPDGTRVPAGVWTAYENDCHLELAAQLRLEDASAVGFTRIADHTDLARAAI